MTPSGAAGRFGVRENVHWLLDAGRGSSHGAQLYFLFLNKPKPSVFFTGTGSSAQTQGKDAFLEARAFLGPLRHLAWTHECVPSGHVCPAFSGELSPPHPPPAHPEAALALGFSAIPLSPGLGDTADKLFTPGRAHPACGLAASPLGRGVCLCLCLSDSDAFYQFLHSNFVFFFELCYMIEH